MKVIDSEINELFINGASVPGEILSEISLKNIKEVKLFREPMSRLGIDLIFVEIKDNTKTYRFHFIPKWLFCYPTTHKYEENDFKFLTLEVSYLSYKEVSQDVFGGTQPKQIFIYFDSIGKISKIGNSSEAISRISVWAEGMLFDQIAIHIPIDPASFNSELRKGVDQLNNDWNLDSVKMENLRKSFQFYRKLNAMWSEFLLDMEGNIKNIKTPTEN